MIVRAYAKINWSLDTVGVREDGYHLLDMVMQSVSLHDTLTLEAAEDLRLHADGPVRVPLNGDNLALRAAEALRDRAGIRAGAAIHLRKRIPSGAGLGGGSSDAAAVLRGLNALKKCDVIVYDALIDENLLEYASENAESRWGSRVFCTVQELRLRCSLIP